MSDNQSMNDALRRLSDRRRQWTVTPDGVEVVGEPDAEEVEDPGPAAVP